MSAKLPDEVVAASIAGLDANGYSHVPGYLADEEVVEHRALLEQQIDALRGSVYPGYSDKRPTDEQVFNLQNKDRRFVTLLTERSLEQILMAKLNDPYYAAIPSDQPNYILGEYIARSSGDPLRLHIDSWIPSPGPRTWMIQVVIALHDRDESRGCTTVVPATHLSGEYTDRDYQDVTALPIKAGDLVLWDSRLWHGALPSQTKEKSWVLVATMQMWWVKPRFDIPRSISQPLYETLTAKEKALLGFCALPPASEFEATDSRGGYECVPDRALR